MAEDFARVGDIELCHESFGDPSAPPLLLVMGLGGQMIWWPEAFCAALAQRGFHVIRYDNRDPGRSTILSDAPVPSPLALLRRDPRAAAYSLEDMAGDAAGLLDHLGIEAAHVVGVSMGAMIAQTLAISHPTRVLSLASVSSTTGAPRVGRTRWRLYPIFLRRPARSREQYVRAFERTLRAIAARGHEDDPARIRELAGRSYDRAYHPAGATRQLAAIVTAPDRTSQLGTLRVPAVAIHGAEDPLVNVSGGRATAAAIPDARLVVIEGMGHELPPRLWPRLIDAIAENAARAPREAASASGGVAETGAR